MDDLEAKVDRDLKNLETTLNNKLQRALDNPLAN
jgi:cell division protein FtsI/penicillin-binding protein 2